MKTLLIAAVGAVALLAGSPAFAATGYVGAQYTYDKVDTARSKDNDANIFGVEGAVAFDATQSLGVDLDAAYSDGDETERAISGAAHIYARGADYKFGGFASVGDVDQTVWSVGVEGQKNWNKWTFAGAAGYANADDSDADIYGLDVEARYFINDNIRLDGRAGYANVDVKPNDTDAWSVGVGGEYQFAVAPISVRVGYTHSELNDFDLDNNAVTVGVRYNWGGSLKERNDKGPSFAGLSRLTSILAR